jgi:peptide/nickel transport system permease protein
VRLLLERATRAAILLIGVSFLSFLLLAAAPGDFGDEIRLNPQISPATVAALRAEFGLDDPVLTRYALWLRATTHGHFGYSVIYRLPVERVIWRRAVNTLLLTTTALVIAWSLAMAIGLGAAMTRRAGLDRTIGILAAALLAIPDLLIALALLTLSAHAGWLPIGGMSSAGAPLDRWAAMRDLAAHMALPVTVLTIATLPALLQHVRRALASSMPPPLAIALAARGLPRTRLVARHSLRLASAPLAALGGLTIGSILSAGLLVEVLVGWPGMGTLMLEAVLARDQFVIVAATVLSTAVLIAGNVIGDLLLYAADPRARAVQ